jgi:hypothetical protein
MWLLLLEAGLALALLLFAVWWVMFSGRDKGEPPAAADRPEAPPATDPQPPPSSDPPGR